MSALSHDCPCGRPRVGCEYHAPALQPAAKEEAERTIRLCGIPHDHWYAVGDRIQLSFAGAMRSGRITALPPGELEVVLDGEVRAVSTKVRVTL